MANNQPTSLPVWNTSAANRTTPPGGKQTSGYTFGENPSSAYDNWFNNLVYQWTLYAQLPTATGANVAAFLAQSLDTSAVALLGGGGNALTADLNAAMTKFPGAGVLGAQIASNLAATAGFANMTAPNLGAGVAGASTNGAGVAGIGGTITLATLLGNVATGNTPGLVGQSSSLAGVLGFTAAASVPGVLGEGSAASTIGGAFRGNGYTRANLVTDLTTYAGAAVVGSSSVNNAAIAVLVGNNTAGIGVLGNGASTTLAGVKGTNSSSGPGVEGSSTTGVGVKANGVTGSRGNIGIPTVANFAMPAPAAGNAGDFGIDQAHSLNCMMWSDGARKHIAPLRYIDVNYNTTQVGASSTGLFTMVQAPSSIFLPASGRIKMRFCAYFQIQNASGSTCTDTVSLRAGASGAIITFPAYTILTGTSDWFYVEADLELLSTGEADATGICTRSGTSPLINVGHVTGLSGAIQYSLAINFASGFASHFMIVQRSWIEAVYFDTV